MTDELSDEANTADSAEPTGTESAAQTEASPELWEWGGAIVAGLGFFMTPILTAPIACYCALKVRQYNTVTALMIVAIVLASIVLWLIVALFVLW